MASNDDGDDFFNHANTADLNSKIMLTAIVSLSFVVLVVTILHVYARCVLRRQARRQATLRRLAFTSFASNDAHTSNPPTAGVDPSVLATLPKFIFRRSASSAAAAECPVCLCPLDDGEAARSLPNCKHTFHADCIDQWLGSHSTCPICRTEAEPRLVAEPREGVAVAAPSSAPPVEGTSEQEAAKIGGSSSRLNSFRRILSRERSSRRMQTPSSNCGQDERLPDLERQ